MESYSLGTNWAPVKLLETRTYSYGDTNWKDKLTEFDGDSITYDKNGNPLTYRDKMTFEWENGRILKNINTSDKAVQMSYDSNGMRTQKSVDGVKTNYYYDSSNNLFALTQGNDTLFFDYDNSGEVMSVSCNGTMYYYIKDLQGDITEIVDKDGKAVAEYAYDAWGNMLTEDNGTLTVGKLTPFRYRSYVYDDETGLYYLQSRYYDPVTGRFINADVYCDTNTDIFGTNMFTYCNNDPINQVDPEGTDAEWVQFSDAVPILWWTEGHTSLLLQDSVNNWWYFYWGDKHAYLRPCGKDNFNVSTLNSYITGFDPRPGHNYYVYATNIFNSKEDANSSVGSKYYLKCNDGIISNLLTFKGNFAASVKYAKNLLEKLYSNSNATQLTETIYQNGKKYTMYHVCVKKAVDKVLVPDEAPLYYPLGYYYANIVGNGKCESYDFYNYNCVQASMDVLLHGDFNSGSVKYQKIIEENQTNPHPNDVYEKLLSV